jgi:hypothetical protein
MASTAAYATVLNGEVEDQGTEIKTRIPREPSSSDSPSLAK